MRIRPPGPERREAGNAWIFPLDAVQVHDRPLPILKLLLDFERGAIKLYVGIQFHRMQAGRQLPMPHLKQNLHQAGDPGQPEEPAATEDPPREERDREEPLAAEREEPLAAEREEPLAPDLEERVARLEREVAALRAELRG